MTAQQTGNIAQTLLIGNQTINVGGRPEWIQSLPLESLTVVRDRLYRASLRHETRALLPLLLPVVLAFLAIALLSVAIADEPLELRHRAWPLVLTLATMIGAPVWFGMYDMRRRHRRVVEAAERRWAEIVVEIAAREELPASRTSFKQLLRQGITAITQRATRD